MIICCYFSPPNIYSISWPLTSGMTVHKPFCVRLNRLRTGLGLFRSTIHKWDLWHPRRTADAE